MSFLPFREPRRDRIPVIPQNLSRRDIFSGPNDGKLVMQFIVPRKINLVRLSFEGGKIEQTFAHFKSFLNICEGLKSTCAVSNKFACSDSLFNVISISSISSWVLSILVYGKSQFHLQNCKLVENRRTNGEYFPACRSELTQKTIYTYTYFCTQFA